MLAFHLSSVEIYALLQRFTENRHYIDPFLGFVGAPDSHPESREKFISEINQRIDKRDDHVYAQLKDFLELFDMADMIIYSKILRPQEQYPSLHIADYPSHILKSKVLDFLPRYRIIRSITGRSAQINFSIIHDEDTYLFIAEDILSKNMQQIQELLYHSIGKNSPLMIEPLNIQYQQSLELASSSRIPDSMGLSPQDTLRMNELLSYDVEQKTTLLVEAKNFTKTYTSPIALGIIDFANRGRIISKPYESFDRSVWIKYVSGTDDELTQAIYEAIALLQVDWFTHQR